MTTTPPNQPILRIRPAEHNDTPHIHRLIRRCYAQHSIPFDLTHPAEAHIREPHHYFQNHNGEFFVARIHTQRPLIATVAYLPRTTHTVPPHATEHLQTTIAAIQPALELKSLYVDPTLRRRGIATQLINHIQTIANQHANGRIILWSDNALLSAHRFYTRQRFQPIGTRTHQGQHPFTETGYTRTPTESTTHI